MDEVWTDYKVNIPNVPARTSNIPGDGKYDNDNIETAEIEVGRVDFINMPAFKKMKLNYYVLILTKRIYLKLKALRLEIKHLEKVLFLVIQQDVRRSGIMDLF
jgi:hypothetical protein